MKNRQIGALWKIGPLLGLCLLLLVLAVDALAQQGPGATSVQAGLKEYAFPYFGPDKVGENLIRGSYIAQSYLFGGFSGQAGTSAISILALLAALGGAIYIVFNQGLWRPDILIAWAILLILLLFNPTGSRLLLMPINQSPETLAQFSFGREQAAAKGEQTAPERDKYYGFSPQVAAIDVASRMQLVVDDMFKSAGWRDLIKEMKANQNLENNGLVVADKSFLAALEKHSQKSCSLDLSELQTSKQAAFDPAQIIKGTGAPETLESVWSQLRTKYLDPTYAQSAPPMIIFPDEDSQLSSSFNISEYVTKLQILYRENGGTETICYEGNASSCTAGTITVKQALQNMGNFFQTVMPNNQIGPGFFLVRHQDLKEADPYASRLRRCYNAFDNNNTAVNTCRGVANTRSALVNQPRTHASTFLSVEKGINDNLPRQIRGSDGLFIPYVNASELGVWQNFQKVYQQIRDMPVVFGDANTDLSTSTTGSARDDAKVRVAAQETYDCKQNAELLARRALQFISERTRNALKPMEKMLLDETGNSIPQTLTITVDSITNKSLLKRDSERLANSLATRFNQIIKDEVTAAGGKGKVDRKTIRLKLLTATLNLVVRNSAAAMERNNPNDPERSVIENSGKVGIAWNPLTGFAGGVAQFMGEVLITLSAFFTGPLAQAYIGFITILVQLSLLALIVMTPFLLIVGVIAPGTAPGMLMVTILAAFVLQFVPVTLLFLNYLGGLVYEMIGATAGPRAWTMQNMLIIAMAGLYTGVVGLTVALMPKLADPFGIMSKISGLDGAAKQAAEAGINAALTAAGTAALPFAGAITSALGNKYGNWARDLAKKGTDAAGLTDGKSKVDSQNGQLEQTKKPEELEALLAGEYGETMEERIKREKAPYANYDATDFTGYPENLTDEENLKRSRERIEAEEMDKNYGPVIPQATDGKVAADGKIAAQVAEDAKNASSKPAGVKLEGVAPDAVVGTKNQKMGINDKPAVVAATDTRAAGTTTGAAAQVAQQADSNNNAAQRTMNQAAANQEAERIAREQKMETGTVFKHNGQTYQVAKDGTVSVAAINPNAQAGAGGAAGGETTVQQTTVLAQEQRLIDELSNLANVLNKASTTEKDSVIGAVMGRQQQAANELDEATEARHAQRKGPDVRISTGQALASGFYGGFEAIFKSAGNIPVIGQILRETSNEWYQGEARARAWNAAGGYKEWKALKSDGQRGKMLKQELGELQPGIEYREMMSVGGYHETYLQGAQAASENAARIQSSYRARQVVADKSADFQGKLVLSAQDLKGIGMADAMNKIASVRTEAAMMQGPGFDTKVATVNPDGSVKFDTVQIKYTPSVFQNWASNAAMSGLIKNMENNNVQQMKVIEKQFFRDGKFDAARATAGSFKAQAQYMRLDPEDSYIDSGELAVREGKIGFMGARGQAHAIRRYLKDQTRNTDEYIESAIKEGLGEFAKVNTEEYKRATRGLSSENLAAYNRKIFGSAAKKALLDSDPGKLPLEAVFDQAYKSAYYGFEQKSLLAVFAKEAEAEVNVGKIISSSRSAAGAKLPLPPNVYQRRRVESKNGSILDVGAVWDELVEKISIATDNDTLLTTSLVQQFMKELEAEGDKNALTSEIRQDKNKRQIVQTMSENSLARLTAVIQRGVTDVAQKDKILSKLNTKLRRDVTGRLVVQIGEIDIDTGNEEKGDGVTPLVPGANTPPPAGTSTGGRPAGGNPQPSFRERAKNFPGVNRPKRT